jgi:urease beta subunit
MNQHFNDSRHLTFGRNVTFGTWVQIAVATAARSVVVSNRERT